MSADVLSLRSRKERRENTRRLHYEAVTLSRGYLDISTGPDWQLDVVAALAIFMTEDRRRKEEFTLTVASPLPGYHTKLDPHLVITDEAASDAYLSGRSLAEIAQSHLGSYAISYPASGEMRLGVQGNFASVFAGYASAASVYVGLSIDSYGCVTVQDVSPFGSEVYANFDGAALSDSVSNDILENAQASSAIILPFPSKSTS